MLQQNSDFSKNKNKFLSAYKELGIDSLLRKSNIRKRSGCDVSKIFTTLLSLVFYNRNLYSYLNSEKADTSVSKNTYYRFLGNMTYRWQIEVFFKSVKSSLGLDSEFQCRYYSAICAHTTIVFTRFIILEWLRRKEKDDRTSRRSFPANVRRGKGYGSENRIAEHSIAFNENYRKTFSTVQ